MSTQGSDEPRIQWAVLGQGRPHPSLTQDAGTGRSLSTVQNKNKVTANVKDVWTLMLSGATGLHGTANIRLQKQCMYACIDVFFAHEIIMHALVYRCKQSACMRTMASIIWRHHSLDTSVLRTGTPHLPDAEISSL